MKNPKDRMRFLEEVELYSMNGKGLNPDDLEPSSIGMSPQQCGQFRRYLVGTGEIYEDDDGFLWRDGYGPKFARSEVSTREIVPNRDFIGVIGFMGASVKVVREGKLELPTGTSPMWQVVEIQLPSVRFNKALLWVGSNADRGPWTPIAALDATLVRLDTEPPAFPAHLFRDYRFLKVGIKENGGAPTYVVIELSEEIKIFIARLLVE